MVKDFLVSSCTAFNVVSVEKSSCKNAVISSWRDVQRERKEEEEEPPFGKGRSWMAVEGGGDTVSVIAQTAEEEDSVHLLLHFRLLYVGCMITVLLA